MLLPLTTFALATTCTPGPNNLMLTASGVNFGFARSAPHMIGVVIGFAVLLAACGGGLGLVFQRLPALHTLLKVAGALYMLWLAWRVATAGRPARMAAGGGTPLSFFEAAAFQWVNPKGVLTALGAAALFVRPDSAGFDTAVMVGIFALATVLSVTLWTFFGTGVARLLNRPMRAKIFNIVMALLLIASIVPMLV
jgi:threonine/homoserine/homoserine lactone efflux protein